MAHAHVSHYAEPTSVAVKGGEVWIECGPFNVRLTREEAAQLAVDLLNVVEAAPIDTQEAGA